MDLTFTMYNIVRPRRGTHDEKTNESKLQGEEYMHLPKDIEDEHQTSSHSLSS